MMTSETRPANITEEVWAAAIAANQLKLWPIMAIARAIMEARDEERECIASFLDEYDLDVGGWVRDRLYKRAD